MYIKRLRLLTYITFAFILALPATFANDSASPSPTYHACREEALNVTEQATLKDYPDADAVILSQATKIEYRPDGTATQWDEGYIKILTEKGRKNNRTISSYYTIPYQNPEDCRIDMIEVIHPDGSSTEVDIAKESSVSINTSNMNANIYNPNDKVITVNINGLQINDIIHYKMYDNTVIPYARGIYGSAFSLEGNSPIIKKDIEIIAPAAFPLKKTAICDEIPGTVTFSEQQEGEKIIYKWVTRDVAQAIPEPNMPSLFTCAQRLLVSTASDWESLSRWYWKLSEPALNDTTESMEAKVRELTADAKTPQEKIDRLFKFVSQDIRYMGITTETVSPGLEPHPVSQTFNAKYGVCRDKAALLVAMLRLAGIEGYPVLIHNGDKRDKEVPAIMFNHAITAAKVDGKFILMDPTDENTQRLLPSYLNDKSYLVATPEGETLHTSNVVPAAENLVTIETTGNLAESGELQANSKITFEGINDNAFRGYFSRINPEERKRLFESVIRKIYGSGTVLECKITPKDLLDTTNPLVAEIDYTAQNILAKGHGYGLMPAPFISSTLGLVNNISYDADLDKRRFPLQVGYTSGVSESVKITLAPEIKKIISLPVYSPVDSENITWSRSLAEVRNNIIGKNEFLIKTTEFSPAEYTELKKALRVIEYNNRKKSVLAVKEEAPKVIKQAMNSDIISNINTTYNILSDSSWEIIEETKKRILNYAGKKDNSEIIVNYNPIWEKVELLEASVTSKDGKMQTISPKEINIMDQPWNGLAPRYSGGKTLIASLPAVDIGSLVEYKIKYTYTKQPFFSLRETFRDFDPLTKSLTVKGIKSLNVQTLWNGPEYKYNADNEQYTWSMSNGPIKKELFLAPPSSFLPTIIASNSNWYKYTADIQKALLAASDKQTAAIQKAKDLTKDINDVLQQLKVIRDYITRNIRLAGPVFSQLPLSSITSADTTLAAGYGNTTDRAILFYTMLQALGIESEFYITTPFTAAEGLKTPALNSAQNNMLQSVIIRTKYNDRTIWLNDTTEYAHLGTTPNVGKLALDIQTGYFKEIKVDTSSEPLQERFYFVNLAENADATISVSKEYYGSAYESRNKLFSEMTPEERKIFFQEELSSLAQSAIAEGELKTEFASYPGRISYTAKVFKYGVLDNKFMYFNLPNTLERLFSLRADNRENPLFINDIISKKIHILIALPKNFRAPAIIPENFTWDSPLFNGEIEVESLIISPLALRSKNIAVPLSKLREDLITTLSDSRSALYITMSAKVTPAFYPAALYTQVLGAQNSLSIPSAKEIMLSIEPEKTAE